MKTDEDLLTGALDRAAGRITPETLRPLAEPGTARLPRRRRAIWNARLAPAAAAAGVVLAVAVALLVTGGTRHESTAAGVLAPGIAGPPKYYAEVEGKFVRWHGRDSVEVVVRSTATGAAVARVPNPAIAGAAKVLPLSVAAGPDGRTFYVIYANWGRVPGDFWIYRFRITPSGAARPAAVSGGKVTGQDNVGNVGGFAISPDGSRLALAVASVHDGSSQSSVASEILVIDLRTGAHAVWRGGMERAGQTFGIENVSWTGDGKSLVYLGEWCSPDNISYGIYGGFVCSTLGAADHKPIKAEGRDVVLQIRVASGGATLDSGRVLRAPSPSSGPVPVLVDPDGTELITMVESPSAPDAFDVVKTSIATGRVVSVLGTVSRVSPLFGDEFLAVDRSGDFVLVWMAGNATSGLPLHGWVHGGRYHQLAPTFRASYPGGWIQMTW
jgi:hypothetical protein